MSSQARVLAIEDPTQHVPPHSTEAEVAVLGAMMMDREAVSKVLEILEPECFYHETHQTIFAAMIEMFNRAVTVDLITLNNELSRSGQLERVGGMYAIADIASRTITAANVDHHARIVMERWLKRSMIRVAGNIIADCYDDTTDALEQVDRAEQQIFEVAEKRLKRSYSGMHKLTKDALDKVFALSQGDGDGITGVPTGFTQLDSMLSGLQPSDLVILAARPSMGKTAFALTVAREAAKRNKPVGLFSLEMSAQQLVLRLISADAEIDLQSLRAGRLTPAQIQEIVKKIDGLMNTPIYIDDSAALTPVEFRAKCRRMKTQHDVQMIIVDYLQLMHAPKAESREREISMISHTLKQVAKELNVPVVALSQLNRASESRTDKKPMLSDLRESGSIEQDADVVMIIHRPEYYKLKECSDGTPAENIAEVIVAKQRNGPTGEVKLYYNKRLASFHDLAAHQGYFEPVDEQQYLPPDAGF